MKKNRLNQPLNQLFMASNFDTSFDAYKTEFRTKFGFDWNTNPELYLSYLRTIYMAETGKVLTSGLGQLVKGQEDIKLAIQDVSKKLKF